MFDCQFILNLTKFWLFFYMFLPIDLKRKKNLFIWTFRKSNYRSTVQIDLYLTAMEFFVQTMITPKDNIKFYRTLIFLTLLLLIENIKNYFISVAPTRILKWDWHSSSFQTDKCFWIITRLSLEIQLFYTYRVLYDFFYPYDKINMC